MRPLTALDQLVNRRQDVRPVAVARVMVGFSALVLVLLDGIILAEIARQPVARFPYVSWLPEPSTALAPWLLAFWTISAFMVMVGWRTPLAGAVLATVIGAVVLFDQQTYANHLYLLVIVVTLLTCAGCGGRWSVDAWRGRSRQHVPAWPVFLLKTQLSIVYGFAALSKLNADFLSGSVLASQLRETGPLTIPAEWVTPRVMMPMAVAGVVIEGALAVAFWWPRWRPLAIVLGVGLHLTMALTMAPPSSYRIAVFAIIMFALYAQFIPFGHGRGLITPGRTGGDRPGRHQDQKPQLSWRA